jgi:hypothetical protein
MLEQYNLYYPCGNMHARYSLQYSHMLQFGLRDFERESFDVKFLVQRASCFGLRARTEHGDNAEDKKCKLCVKPCSIDVV